jgi:hypothetical protein
MPWLFPIVRCGGLGDMRDIGFKLLNDRWPTACHGGFASSLSKAILQRDICTQAQDS